MRGSHTIIEQAARYELKVRNSRFIASVFPVSSEDEIASHLNGIRREFHDATHNPHAYRLFREGRISCRSSEDGEPPGTSGSAILKMLESLTLVNILVVVTRYFGGTKLGVGGLRRAYLATAKKAVESSSPAPWIRRRLIVVRFPFRYADRIERFVGKWEGRIERRSFGRNVLLEISLPEGNEKLFCREIRSLTMGEVTVDPPGVAPETDSSGNPPEGRDMCPKE